MLRNSTYNIHYVGYNSEMELVSWSLKHKYVKQWVGNWGNTSLNIQLNNTNTIPCQPLKDVSKHICLMMVAIIDSPY